MKTAVLVSGGVDSSVALHLLRDRGVDLTAFYLKIWLEDELDFLGDCPWEEDLRYVREVCDLLDVPLEIIPLQQAYRERIISYTLEEARRGRTPNPDLLCNHRIKFGVFQERIGDDYAFIATGHYARVDGAPGRRRLWRAPDPVKDQTYFLAHLEQHQLSRALFPVGEFHKGEVRRMAAAFNLPNRDRPDSQGLCFLGKINFRDFIKHHLGEKKGPLVELETGIEMGEHAGFWFYTIGQRSGLGLSGGPWYVAARETDSNTVFISRDYFSDDKSRNELDAEECHWIAGGPPEKDNLQVKLRHGAETYNCTIRHSDSSRVHVMLEGRDQGIAAGQFAVFYDGEECLGCGRIR